MPEHYPKNVLETTTWCNTCRRFTQHYVWSGRLGRCKEDHHKTLPLAPDSGAQKGETQSGLFDTEEPETFGRALLDFLAILTGAAVAALIILLVER